MMDMRCLQLRDARELITVTQFVLDRRNDG